MKKIQVYCDGINCDKGADCSLIVYLSSKDNDSWFGWDCPGAEGGGQNHVGFWEDIDIERTSLLATRLLRESVS